MQTKSACTGAARSFRRAVARGQLLKTPAYDMHNPCSALWWRTLQRSRTAISARQTKPLSGGRAIVNGQWKRLHKQVNEHMRSLIDACVSVYNRMATIWLVASVGARKSSKDSSEHIGAVTNIYSSPFANHGRPRAPLEVCYCARSVPRSYAPSNSTTPRLLPHTKHK